METVFSSVFCVRSPSSPRIMQSESCGDWAVRALEICTFNAKPIWRHLIGRDVFPPIASHPRLKSEKTKCHHVVLLVGITTISVLWKFSMYYAWGKLWNIFAVESVNQPVQKPKMNFAWFIQTCGNAFPRLTYEIKCMQIIFIRQRRHGANISKITSAISMTNIQLWLQPKRHSRKHCW